MSQNWYLMAFGVELGPMSWDDLLERSSRGDLRLDSQIRRGESGPFIQAGDVPGLFGPSGDEPDESAWFCEVLGTELGPMSWKELCLLAERGTLRGDARVRCGKGAWVAASSLVPLAQRPIVAADHSTAPPSVAPTEPTTVPAQLEEVLVQPERVPVQPKSVVEQAARVSAPTTKAVASPAPRPHQDAHAIENNRTAAHPAANPKAVAAAPTKPVKSAPRRSPARPVALHFPVRSAAVLAGILLAACVGYFGWVLLKSRSLRPDYQQVAGLYRQTYEQIKQFRSHPQKQSPAGLRFQFSRRVAALRAQLNQWSSDPSAGRLAEAATQLEQMLADCQPSGDPGEASRFADNEQRFLTLLDSFKSQQSP
ncbi:MAG TPA: hypothetical protein VG826_01965 [Pirellulales bacterium]|nr:hypothetical protein [Pirellulales bacterium]